MASYFPKFFGGGNPPKTEAFRSALQKYATAASSVKNLKGLSEIINKAEYSKPLLNSIAKAFAANNQATETVGNINASEGEQIRALTIASNALNDVTRKATSKENLDKIMKKIFNSASGKTNQEKRTLYKGARSSKLNNNIALGSNEYGNFLSSLKQNNPGPTRANSLLSEAARPNNKKSYANMNSNSLILAAYNTTRLSNNNRQKLASAIRTKRNNDSTSNNTRKQLGEVLHKLYKPASFFSRLGRALGRK